MEQAASRHVTVVVSSGDTGPFSWPSCTLASLPFSNPNPVREPSFPPSDPLVLSVGGTRLHANKATGAYISEDAWDQGSESSGGGFSKLFPQPSYQRGMVAGHGRGVPDVAADASTVSGLALVFKLNGQDVIQSASGTSAGAPFWAGIVALADQYAGHDLGCINPVIYKIASGPLYHTAFHNITKGDNTMLLPKLVIGYRAGPGWSPVTGWGTPDAAVLVPLLAGRALK